MMDRFRNLLALAVVGWFCPTPPTVLADDNLASPAQLRREWRYWTTMKADRKIGAAFFLTGDKTFMVDLRPTSANETDPSHRGLTQFWDLTGPAPRKRAEIAPPWPFPSITAFSPDAKRLATMNSSSFIDLWDVEAAREIGPIRRTYTRQGGHLSFSPDGRLLALAEPFAITVWDGLSRRELYTIRDHHTSPSKTITYSTDYTFAPDGKRFATFGPDEVIKLWDSATGQPSITLRGHKGRVNDAAFLGDGKTLASIDFDGTGKLWDLSTGHERWNWRLPGTGDRLVLVPPKSRSVLFAHRYPFKPLGVQVFDADTGRERFAFDEVSAPFACPDGKTVGFVGRDGTIRLREMGEGSVEATLREHEKAVETSIWTDRPRSIRFSNDGRILASLRVDGTVELWKSAEPAGDDRKPVDR